MTQPNLQVSAQSTLRPIVDVAAELELNADDLEMYGSHKAKLCMSTIRRLLGSKPRRGKFVFVTAITPTKAGEGKTTVTIGLAEALCQSGSTAICALRQPSLGPVFGIKGGATGGGKAQVVPAQDINVHFTGDLHAIGAANNLLAALVDNHLFHSNALRIDARTVTFRRALDMNDRSLRSVVTGLGGKSNGYLLESGFDITAASEVMAVFCLSESLEDLRKRLGSIVVARDTEGAPVTAAALNATGALTLLLKDAIKPNLVQTLEGTPAFVHGGPFANIAHGCSSILATKVALRLGDFVLTEGGFGADLGFEKFCDIVASSRQPELTPDAVVLVATVRALKAHGGMNQNLLATPDVEALKRGLPNLTRHAKMIERFGLPLVIAVNRFSQDTEEEISVIKAHCHEQGWRMAVCDVFSQGGKGGLELAQIIKETCSTTNDRQFTPAYDQNDPILQKLSKLATRVYGAQSVELTASAKRQLLWLDKHGFGTLPVCVAKTQYSFSDNPSLFGAPENFSMTVRDLRLSAGAGFVVALMGDTSTMPGLPKQPAAVHMDVDDEGNSINGSW